MIADRLLAALGALFGAAGIVLMAAAAHGTMPGLVYAAQMLLGHAGALLAIAAAIRTGLVAPGIGRVAGYAIGAGAALFAADIGVLAFSGGRLFPMAAPTGGVVAIAGWLLLAVAALAPRRA